MIKKALNVPGGAIGGGGNFGAASKVHAAEHYRSSSFVDQPGSFSLDHSFFPRLLFDFLVDGIDGSRKTGKNWC